MSNQVHHWPWLTSLIDFWRNFCHPIAWFLAINIDINPGLASNSLISNMNLKFIFNFLIIVASKSISTKKLHSIRQPKSRFFELSRSGRDLLHWNRMGNRFSRRSEIKRLQGAAQHRYLAKVCDHLRAVSQDQDNISDFCRSF